MLSMITAILSSSYSSSCSRGSSTAWGEVAASGRAQGPGGGRENGKDARTHRASAIAHRQVGGDRSGVGEDCAGVGPLLEPGEAGDQQRHRAGHLPDAQDDQEIGRVAELLDDAADVWDPQQVPDASHAQLGGDEYGGDPVGHNAALVWEVAGELVRLFEETAGMRTMHELLVSHRPGF